MPGQGWVGTLAACEGLKALRLELALVQRTQAVYAQVAGCKHLLMRSTSSCS